MANETKRDRLRAFLAKGKWNALMIVDAILESPFSHSEKLTLIAISSHRSDSSQYPNPGLRRLGELCSQRPHTVGAVVDRLEKRGILRVSKRERQVTTYDLSAVMPGLLAVYPSDTAAVSSNGTDKAPEVDATCADRDNSAVSNGDSGCVERGHVRNQEKEPREGTNGSASQSSAGFTLAPAPSTTKRAASRKKRPNPEGDPDPRVTELRDFYVAEFRATKGAEPFLGKQWPRAMKAFKELLDAAKDVELAKSIIRRALADEWHRQNRCQPWEIVADANKFIGTVPVRRIGHRGPITQPNDPSSPFRASDFEDHDEEQPACT